MIEHCQANVKRVVRVVSSVAAATAGGDIEIVDRDATALKTGRCSRRIETDTDRFAVGLIRSHVVERPDSELVAAPVVVTPKYVPLLPALLIVND